MKHLIWNLYSDHRKNASIFIGGLGICILGLALFWGISALVLIPQTSSLSSKIKSDMTTLAVQRSSSGDKAGANTSAIPSGSAAIEQLQETLVSDTEAYGCGLVQFTPDASPGAYISAYGVQDPDFGSYHVRTTMRGNLGSMLLCLQKLNEGPVPFEIISMSMDGTGGANAASMSLTLQVLVKTPPPAAGAS